SSIDEVNAAVRTLDEMTQHNAALVEETNAALEQAEAQASELDRIVEVFTLGESAGGASPAREDEGETGDGPAPPAVRDLQDRVREVARTYLGASNAATDLDWAEF